VAAYHENVLGWSSVVAAAGDDVDDDDDDDDDDDARNGSSHYDLHSPSISELQAGSRRQSSPASIR